ncbi:efflux RND transporter periplasmic adaptor subunit [Portibacter marinus]|uniref:efflux RND transporter periplasmic adaptor subunit n=1 Tax=Portibacter marinus TaxID=2898660 RepID=UPI001F239B77|nr:efflux RND transporter periplasmic adaptor subunit [Portibacter marinus]
MKNYRIYIVGAIFLITGLAIGWLIKPTPQHNQEEHTHTGSEMSASNQVYTCSMHPQIRQNEPGICPICEMDLVPLDNSMANDNPTILRMSEEAAKLAQIQTFTVGGDQQNLNQQGQMEISVDGTVELDERTIKSQTSHLPGRIEEMSVTFEGQYVSSGSQIATLYSTELLAASQELLTAAKYNNRVQGLENAAKQKLKNWKITDAQIQMILTNGVPMETIPIFADHSGYVLEKRVSQGDHVREGETLYTIGNTGRLWLIFNVFESDLANVKKGARVSFTTPSVPNKTFEARISYIEPLLNSNTRTAVVRAEINNTGNQLKPGMLLDGVIKPSTTTADQSATSSLTIPSSAVLWTGDRSVVYVQVPDTEVPSYEFREVTVTNRGGGYLSVSDGLAIGEQVVTEGAFAVDAAAQLNNNFSMMNRIVKIKKNMAQDVVPSYIEMTPAAFQEQLDLLINSYLQLKNALVETDGSAARKAAVQFVSDLEKVDMTLLSGEAHMYWMQQLKALDSHGSMISESEEVEEQRNQFDFLSQALINSVKAFGTHEDTYYVQHCPMAKGNEGADWISSEKAIRNPYFGDKMMKCGTVKLELN